MPKGTVDISAVTIGELDSAIASKSMDGPTDLETEVEALVSCANALARRSTGFGLDLASELLALSKSAGKLRAGLDAVRAQAGRVRTEKAKTDKS